MEAEANNIVAEDAMVDAVKNVTPVIDNINLEWKHLFLYFLGSYVFSKDSITFLGLYVLGIRQYSSFGPLCFGHKTIFLFLNSSIL